MNIQVVCGPKNNYHDYLLANLLTTMWNTLDNLKFNTCEILTRFTQIKPTCCLVDDSPFYDRFFANGKWPRKPWTICILCECWLLNLIRIPRRIRMDIITIGWNIVSSLHKVHVKRCVKVTCVTNTDHIVKYSHSLGGLEQTYAMMYKVNWIFSLSISIFWGFACVFVPHISFFIRHLEFYIFISTDRWMHTLYAKLSFSTQIFCPSQF